MNTTNNTSGMATREQILRFIQDYKRKHGYAPTVREIGPAVGLKSTSSVHYHIQIMLKAGMLETDAGMNSPRALRVPDYSN